MTSIADSAAALRLAVRRGFGSPHSGAPARRRTAAAARRSSGSSSARRAAALRVRLAARWRLFGFKDPGPSFGRQVLWDDSNGCPGGRAARRPARRRALDPLRLLMRPAQRPGIKRADPGCQAAGRWPRTRRAAEGYFKSRVNDADSPGRYHNRGLERLRNRPAGADGPARRERPSKCGHWQPEAGRLFQRPPQCHAICPSREVTIGSGP